MWPRFVEATRAYLGGLAGGEGADARADGLAPDS